MNTLSLTSKDHLTQLAHNLGLYFWPDLLDHVQRLPYGRNTNRITPDLVFTEGRGTCSTKHALLKKMADTNHIKGVQLILGMYKMTECNTLGIGKELTKHSLEYIPEAHCYLKIHGRRKDLTTINADISKIEKEIITEKEITPDKISTYKVAYHKAFLQHWLREQQLNITFDQLWEIREQCIKNITRATCNSQKDV